MQIITTIYDTKLIIIDSLPESEITDKKKALITTLFKKNLDEVKSKRLLIKEERNSLNYLFLLPSPQSQEEIHVMLSIFLDEHENTLVFQPIIMKYVEKIIATPEIYSGIYFTQNNDNVYYKECSHRLHTLLEHCHSEILKKEKKSQVGLANIIFFGIQAVGKTSIIKHLINGQFTQTRPTLAPQILKLYFEQVDFRVFDVGGQKNLRKLWTTKLQRPQAIIYVLDCSHDIEALNDSVFEFNRIMKHYFIEHIDADKLRKIPVLILANKKDINPDLTIENIINDYNISAYDINYRVNLCSALTGDGLIESFQWLTKTIKISK
ncbi:ADP-ribosylation factor-like protein [Candidatus Lokiarchaeum ossiferum]|uniref:ADP-ribosylation factor-like protein n=1 Tax=Candidatus Lokiarchaeum ossiferum TaxID=2951803 RepID=UPI00352EC353